jgi:hypothetical protein
MFRRVLAVATAASLLIAALPGAALAAPPTRMSDAQTSVDCELTSGAGTTLLSVGISDSFGEFGDLAFWSTSAIPFEDPPTWISDTFSVEVSPDGTELTATFDLFEFNPTADPEGPPIGAAVGTATLDAVLTPVGAAEDFSDSFRDGNRRIRVSGTFQPLAVSGTVELPEDISYSNLSGCFASEGTFSIFETNPNTFVFRSDQLIVACTWEDEESFVSVFGVVDEFGTYADVFVSEASGTYFGFSDAAVLTTSAFSASFALESEGTGEIEGGATASATLTLGERLNSMDRFDRDKFKIIGHQLLVDGTLELETPGGSRSLPMNNETCFAQDARVISMHSNPNPGKGPRLANDAPDGAIALAMGESIRVRTGGTAEAPEEPCIVSVPEEGDFEIPLGHTAWYTVDGTAGPVTIDSAGSDFDTVMGVYTSDGGAFNQVACVDDVFDEPDASSLQARVTIDTVAGVTYYVQVGGYSGATGRLQLSVY